MTTAIGAKHIARHRPAPTRLNPQRREEKPDAPSTRIARIYRRHSRYDRGSVPCSHPPLSRSADLPSCHCSARSTSSLEFQIHLLRAPVLHSVSRVVDRAFRYLHLYAQSTPRHLAGTTSGVSRSEHENRAV